MPKLVLIAHNIRSCHNVGSLLRTAEGLGVSKVYLSGYTPYPMSKNDRRLPHISRKTTNDIHKTALGAENLIDWQQVDDIDQLLSDLQATGYLIGALEQADGSTQLADFKTDRPLALLVGREVEGLETELVERADVTLEIPMAGQKESFNVVQAAAMALYQLTFYYDK